MNQLTELVQTPLMRASLIMLAMLLAALFARLVLFRLISRLTARTRSDVDDDLIRALRNPVALSLILGGLAWAIAYLELSPTLSFVFLALLKTGAVIVWSGAAMRVGAIFLDVMSRHRERMSWIQPKTVPLIQIGWKILIIASFIYFFLISWHINPASWVASAGVAGIAIGFAAKDTLANLFAGLFIVADAPYKLGDFVVLDSGLRGMITDIGLRSSRILTRDDIEVTVPNAIIANGKIVNETGGRHTKMRVRVSVSVAYGSDIDQVRQAMLACSEGAPHVVPNPTPRVRFREFGPSGMRFELLVWIEQPVYRGRVLDNINEAVYKAFAAKGIEIPYAKQDVYIRELPPGRSSA